MAYPLPDVSSEDYNAAQAAKFAAATQPVLDHLDTSPDTPPPDPTLSPNQQVVKSGGTPSLRSRNLISNQFSYIDDQELTPAEAMAACGPTAALAFARYAGRNPTIGEALRLAKQNGWTPSLGMAGPQSEVSLLGQLGVHSQYNQGASPNDVAAEVQAGRPVIVDTPQHYFAIDDFNPQTGLFHVGGSGLALRGGSEWMSWQQIAAHGGGARGSITIQSPSGQPLGLPGPRASASPPAGAPPVSFESYARQALATIDQGVQSIAGQPDATSQRANVANSPNSSNPSGSPSFATFARNLMATLDGGGSPQNASQPRSGAATGTQQAPEVSQAAVPGYNDMAGALSSPSQPYSSQYGQPAGFQGPPPMQDTGATNGSGGDVPQPDYSGLPGYGGVQPAPGANPLVNIPQAIGQRIGDTAEGYNAAYTPTLPSQPGHGPLARFTPEQLQAQQELAIGAVLGVQGEAPKIVGEAAGPVAAKVGEAVSPLLRDAGQAIEGYAGPVEQAAGNAASTVGAALDPAAQKLVTMFSEPPAPAATPLADRVKGIGDSFVRAWTDRGVDLARFQQNVEKTIGRPLRVDEMAAELSRLNPDKAAEVKIQQGLQPAIQSVPKEDLPLLSTYLTAQHNLDVAKAIGQRVETAGLNEPLARTVGEQRVQSIQSQIQAYQRLRDAGAAAGDGTAVTHYDQLLADSQRKLLTANRLALKQLSRADVGRQASATAAGQQAEVSRVFSGGLNAADSARVLQSLPTELGPQRFGQIDQAAQQVWSFAQSLRDQAVRSGLWTPELGKALQEQYPHYVPTKILDYMATDASGIANGASLSVRDQGLKRLTLEGTARVREDPLASLVRSAYQMEALTKKNDAFNAFVKLNDLLPDAKRIIRPVTDSYTATASEAKVTGFIGGKKATYVMPKEFETVVKQEANAPIKGLAPAMALYRSLITSLSPAFVAGQVPLDASSYIIREAVRGGGPQALPAVLKELFSAYGDAFTGITRRTYAGEDTARFLSGGGGMGGHFQGQPGTARQTIADLARPNAFTIQSADDVRRIVRDLLTLKPVEAMGERFELAPRVASMRLAEQRGANPVQAVINGRTVTMDFQQGGTVAKFINQFVPFFNVGFQGLATPARVVRDNPKAALTTFLAYLAAPTVAAEAWNNADPQRKKDYEDVPQYVKDRSVVVMLPVPAPLDAQGERRPQYFEIRAREFAPFVDLTRETMRRVLGNDTRSWSSLASGALNASSPIQTDSAEGLFGSLIPPGISTGVQLASNRDFYRGSNIATAGNDQRASSLSEGAAGALFGVAGVNARPSQVEFAARDLTGGAGQIVRDVGNVVAGKPNPGTPQDIPVVGQVTRRFVGGSIGQRLQSAQDERVSPGTRAILRGAGLYDIAPVQGSIRNLPLSRDEQAAYQQATNQLIDQLLPVIAQTDAYQALSPADRATVLQHVMDKARQIAQDYTLKHIDAVGMVDRLQREKAAAGH